MPSVATPVLFLSHGAPPLADDARWPAELAAWAADLPRPEAILMVSAHWEQAPPTLSATTRTAPLLYDFWGFPQHYYEVTYPSPPAAAVGAAVDKLVPGVRRDEGRGLDHGAYVPLVEMYPEADVPVVQLSLPTLDPGALVEFGRRLAPLRDDGVLIVGSGFTTHNLRWFRPSRAGSDAPPPQASVEFDAWAAETVASGDLDALVDVARLAPAAHEAHPRTEHWAPVYVALGAAEGGRGAFEATSAIDGFWYGLSKRSWQFA